MQQFVVPQFIDVEDKIFGPISTRQFIILLVAGIVLVLFYRFADFALFMTVLILFGGSSIVLAFLPINGQPFHFFLLNLLQTWRKPNLRIWRKAYSVEELQFLRKLGSGMQDLAPAAKKAPPRRHIQNLALIVNTGGFYQGDDSDTL